MVSDKKLFVSDHWESYVLSAQDYYPFGMSMPGRKHNGGTYRYGFNGQEKQTEMGEGFYTAEFWEYDARIGRRLNVDPKPNVSISVYACFENNPIFYSDVLGDSIQPGAGFWSNAWNGFKDGGTSTVNLVKSLGTSEGWYNMASGFAAMSPTSADPRAVMSRVALFQRTSETISAVPNWNRDQWGYSIGYGTEKVAESALLSKGAGLVGKGLSLVNRSKAVASVWKLTPFERGVAIEKMLGQNLPQNFPVIDKFNFTTRHATSIKSIDLGAKSYSSTSSLFKKLQGYVDDVSGFNGRTWAKQTVPLPNSRALEIAIPHSGSAAQQAVMNRITQYGASLPDPVQVSFRIIK
jgi:RHS repeat-associated protein